jgi:hypothetical protein
MKAHELIVVALILGALCPALFIMGLTFDMTGLSVLAMFVALCCVFRLANYFTTDRCPACQLPGALESTSEWRHEPSSGFWEREKDENRVQCKQCGHSEWQFVDLGPPAW